MILGREEFIISDEEDSCTTKIIKKISSIDPSIEVKDNPGLLQKEETRFILNKWLNLSKI